MDIGKEYLQTAISRLESYRQLAEKTFEQLPDEDLFRQPSSESNSIAIIVQHMWGNMMSRWTNFLTEDGEKTWRKRDEEFETMIDSRQNLMKLWNEGWSRFMSELKSLKATDLPSKVKIRGEQLSAMDAITRQIAHYSYHVGQIIYIGKMFRDRDWKSLSIPKNRKQQDDELIQYGG